MLHPACATQRIHAQCACILCFAADHGDAAAADDDDDGDDDVRVAFSLIGFADSNLDLQLQRNLIEAAFCNSLI